MAIYVRWHLSRIYEHAPDRGKSEEPGGRRVGVTLQLPSSRGLKELGDLPPEKVAAVQADRVAWWLDVEGFDVETDLDHEAVLREALLARPALARPEGLGPVEDRTLHEGMVLLQRLRGKRETSLTKLAAKVEKTSEDAPDAPAPKKWAVMQKDVRRYEQAINHHASDLLKQVDDLIDADDSTWLDFTRQARRMAADVYRAALEGREPDDRSDGGTRNASQ